MDYVVPNVGVQGPRMLALAGEIRDGVLINASHPKDLEEAIAHIEEGLNNAERSTDDVDIVAYTSFSVHEDFRKALKAVVPVVAFIVAGCPDEILERHGINPKSALEMRDNLVKGNFGNAFAKVSHEMVDAFSVSGTPDMCVEKIAAISKAGVSQFVADSPLGPDVRTSINLLASQIIPNFKVAQVCL